MNAIWPFAARPNGGGTWRREPAISPTAISAATIRARTTRSGTSRVPGLRAQCELHGEPPFGEPPGRQRARARGPGEDAREQVLGLANVRVRVKPGGEEEVEIVGSRSSSRHAGPPSATPRRASASSAARIVWVARCSRDRTVPGGTASTAAASSSEIAEVVVEHDHGPLVGIEALESALELIPVEQAEVGVGLGCLQGVDVELEGATPAVSACLAMARVDEQSVEPGLEAVGIAEAVDVAPGGHERLLGRVLGRGLVTQDQPGDDEEPADRDARQLCERVVIAHHRPLHEIPVHRASRCARPWWPRYNPMSRRTEGRFPNSRIEVQRTPANARSP